MKTHAHTRYSRQKEVSNIIENFFGGIQDFVQQLQAGGQGTDALLDLRSQLYHALLKFGDKERKAARRLDIDKSTRGFTRGDQ